jgi:hypothetical protein
MYSTKIIPVKIVRSRMLITLLFPGSWFLSMPKTVFFRSASNSMFRFAVRYMYLPRFTHQVLQRLPETIQWPVGTAGTVSLPGLLNDVHSTFKCTFVGSLHNTFVGCLYSPERFCILRSVLIASKIYVIHVNSVLASMEQRNPSVHCYRLAVLLHA